MYQPNEAKERRELEDSIIKEEKTWQLNWKSQFLKHGWLFLC